MAKRTGNPLLPRITLALRPIGPDGKVGRWRRIRANFWVKQMAAILYANIGWVDATAVDVNGTSGSLIVTISGYTIRMRIGSVTGSTQGIVAGTSNAALDRDQFNLQAKISHGNGAGQLFYNTQLYDPLTAITGGYRLRLFRQLDNNSGNSITIQEVGLIVDHNWPGVLNNFTQFLVLRDLIPGGHAVPNGGSVILRYDLEWLV